MKAEDYRDALALYAEADQRATAQMIELVTAAVVLKLAPPAGEDVATVTLSAADLEAVAETHYIETSYDEAGMTLHLTALNPK